MLKLNMNGDRVVSVTYDSDSHDYSDAEDEPGYVHSTLPRTMLNSKRVCELKASDNHQEFAQNSRMFTTTELHHVYSLGILEDCVESIYLSDQAVHVARALISLPVRTAAETDCLVVSSQENLE